MPITDELPPLPDGDPEWQTKLEWLKIRRLILEQALEEPPRVQIYLDGSLLARKDLIKYEMAPDTDIAVWHLSEEGAEELGMNEKVE